MTQDPSSVWHYCPSKAFESIVKQGRLRLSDMRFTNDSREVAYARELIEEVVRVERPLGFNEALAGFSKHLALSACFSAAGGDVLSQWRGYADGGRGFAIGISVDSLRRLRGDGVEVQSTSGGGKITFLGPRFGPVVYDRTEQVELVRRICAAGAENLPGRLLLAAPFLKHAGFSEEAEWRLSSGHLSLDGGRRFTNLRHPGTVVQRSRMTRFDAIDLKAPEFSEDKNYGCYPIVESVGLGPQNESFVDDVAGFMTVHNAGWRHVDVLRSATSYEG